MAEALPISGNIDPKAFPFLLMDLHHHGATGSLKVAGPTYQKALYFRSGRILFGSSNDPRDQLGAILIEGGKITPEQLEDVNAKVGPGNPLAKVLTDTGFVSQRELSDAARAKVERILSDVLGYGSGSFDFEDGVLPKGAVDLKLSTERLTVSAVRRITDRTFVLRHIDGLDIVLSPSPTLAERLGEVSSETGGLTEHLDGKRTLKEAAAKARIDEFDAAKIACGLLFLGLVSRKAAAAPGVELDLGATAADAFSSVARPAPVRAPEPPAKPEEDAPFVIPELDAGPTLAFVASPSEPTIHIEPPKAPSFGGGASAVSVEPEPFVVIEPSPPVSVPASTIALDEPPKIALDPPKVTPAAPAASASGPAIDVAASVPPPAPAGPTRMTGSDRAALDSVLKRPPAARSIDAATQIAPPSNPSRQTRPSKEDLAALDELLNTRNAEGPMTPLEKPAGGRDWSPQFSTRSGRRGGGRDRSGPLTVALAAILLAGAAGGGYWYWQRGPAAPVAAATPAPTTAPASSTAASQTTLTPASAPVIPATTGGAVPGAVSTTLAAAPVTAAPASRPAATVTDPRVLLRQGRYPEAGQRFLANVRNAPQGSATIQLLVACSDETIQKAVNNVSDDELFIVPFNLNGRPCYRVLWGLYPSSARASGALGALPGYFRDAGAKPRVVAAGEIGP